MKSKLGTEMRGTWRWRSMVYFCGLGMGVSFLVGVCHAASTIGLELSRRITLEMLGRNLPHLIAAGIQGGNADCEPLDESEHVSGPPLETETDPLESVDESLPSTSEEFLIDEGPLGGEISVANLIGLRVDADTDCLQATATGSEQDTTYESFVSANAASSKSYDLELEVTGKVPYDQGVNDYLSVRVNHAEVFSSLSAGVPNFNGGNPVCPQMHSFTVTVPVSLRAGEIVQLTIINIGRPYIEDCYAEITNVTCVGGSLRDLDGCVNCTGVGSGTVNIADNALEVSIGAASVSSPKLGNIGRLCLIDKYTTDPNLSLAGCLAYVANHDDYEVIHDHANSLSTIRQVKGADGIADVIRQTDDRFDIKIYSEDQVGALVNGVYQLTGSPDRTYTVERSHNAGLNLTESLVCEVVGGSTLTNSFSYNGNTSVLSLNHPEGLCDESISTTTESGGTVRVETLSVYDPQNGGVLIRKEVKKFKDLGWGETMIEHQRDPDNGGDKVTYTYYTNTSDNGYQQLKDVTSTHGPGVSYDYDSSGRLSLEYRAFENGPLNQTVGVGRTRAYFYTPFSGSGDDGTVKPDEPRRILERIDGQEVRESFLVLKPDYREEIIATTDGSSWNSSNHLRTITTFGNSGISEDKPLKIEHADGTLTLYSYVDNGNGTVTTTVWNGEPNGGGTSVIDGVKTETTRGSAGEIISIKVYDVASAKKIDETLYSNFDDDHRAQDITFFDGTTESINYGCCGIDSITDRNNVITSYLYDGLKRQTHETRLGVTLETAYNALGDTLSVTRIGTDQSQIVLRSMGYGLDGKMISQTNALNGVTTYSRTVLGGGQLQVTTTFPDSGTHIETFYLDGALEKVTGTAAFPERYDSGTMTVTDDFGTHPAFYRKTTKLDASGSTTSEWERTIEDFVGRAFRTEYAASSGTPTSEVRYNSLGQMIESEDPDGVVSYFFYNGLGERYRTGIDVNGDQTITENGVDRIQETVRSVVSAWGTDVVRTEVSDFPTNSSTTKRLISRSDVSVDGLKTWNQSFRTPSNPVLRQTETVYNGSTRTETSIEPSGRKHIRTFTDGRLTQVKSTDSSNNVLTQTDIAFDVHGRQSTATDLRNGTTTTQYNDADLVQFVTTPLQSDGIAQTTETHYDGLLRPTDVTFPDGRVATTQYFETGRVKKVFGARTMPVEYTYDPQGRVATMKTWQSFNETTGQGTSGSATTRWNYDIYRGWLSSKDFPNATTGAPTSNGPSYTYTDAGRLKTRAWERGVTMTNTYDADTGDLEQASYSDSTPTVVYSYDRSGRISTVARNGITTTYGYNDANQATSESHSGGTLSGFSVERTMDNALRLTQVQSKDGSTVLDSAGYSYSGTTGRLSTVTHNATSMTYSYLSQSDLMDSVTFGGTKLVTSRAYDSLNRLTSISSAASGASLPLSFAYSYNLANQRTRIDEADGKYSEMAYDSLGQLTSSVRRLGGGQVISGQDFEYEYDDIGNRTETGGRVSAESTYTVNRLNEIDSRTISDEVDIIGIANPTANVTVNSNVANREGEYFHHELSVSNSSAPAYPTVTVTSTYGGGASASGELFVPETPETRSYDADGNLTQDGRWDYTWDGENRLIEMKTISGIPVAAERRLEFEYDYQGRRIRKKVYDRTSSGTLISDIKFLYDGWNVIAELDGSDTLLQTYVWGLDLSGSYSGAGGVGGLLKVEDHDTGGEGHYVAYDGNGNVVALVSESSGNITARYEYGPFGEQVRATGNMAVKNPFQFSTKSLDLESGFYYYGMRYYNPTTGRWISRDPIEEDGGLNLYGFVGNEPMGNVDLRGLRTVGVIIHVPDGGYVDRRTRMYLNRVLENVENLINRKITTDVLRLVVTSIDPDPSGLGPVRNADDEVVGWRILSEFRQGNRNSPPGRTNLGDCTKFQVYKGGIDASATIAAANDLRFDRDMTLANVMAHEALRHVIADWRHPFHEALLDPAIEEKDQMFFDNHALSPLNVSRLGIPSPNLVNRLIGALGLE